LLRHLPVDTWVVPGVALAVLMAVPNLIAGVLTAGQMGVVTVVVSARGLARLLRSWSPGMRSRSSTPPAAAHSPLLQKPAQARRILQTDVLTGTDTLADLQ
jgi:hypothetical protein